MKRVTTSLWFALMGFLSVTVCAYAPQTGSPQILEQKNDLSWPMTKLLEPSLKWERKVGSFPHALGFFPSLLNLIQARTALAYYPMIDLPGEWFVTVISTRTSSAGVSVGYDTILKGAGYSQYLFLRINT